MLVAAIVGCLILVGLFFALLFRSSGDSAVRQVRGGHVTLLAAAKRKALPDLVGATLMPPPRMIRLSALEGRPVFVDVWASWCFPCREEAPLLARLWRAYRTDVDFVGIDVEDSRGSARQFIRRYALGYPSIFDPRASMAAKLGFVGLPTAFLIDHRGRIAATLIGKQRESTLRSALTALIRGPE